MKKLNNPFVDRADYYCFGCSPKNDIGLKMEFYEDGEYIKSYWKPDMRYQGYKNILHGGVQTLLMDEIAS